MPYICPTCEGFYSSPGPCPRCNPHAGKIKCPRCSEPMAAFSMSWFNEEEICPECKDDERACPNYVRAREAELEAVKSGDRKYPGIGLAVADLKVLAQRRAARKADEA